MFVLVIQSFGEKNEYTRAIFTIWSFYAHSNQNSDSTQTILFTDNPDYFKTYLRELPVKYVLLTPDKIREMRGEINFLHRMKIALIEEAFTITKSSLLYADSDSFFTKDISAIIKELNPQVSFMHKPEYEFESLALMRPPAAIPFHAFLNLIKNQNFTLSNNQILTASPKHFSWNAGVMLLHNTHSALIPDVYALTSQFFIPTQNHASEQYAFSIILSTHTELKSCEEYNYHYWYRIEKKIADKFLKIKIQPTWGTRSFQQKKEDVKKWTRLLPSHFKSHIFTLRDNAIQAFNENKFKQAYYFTIRALLKNPFNLLFIKDVLYHTKRLL